MRTVLFLVTASCYFGCSNDVANNTRPTPTTVVNADPKYPIGPPPQPNCPDIDFYYLVTQNLLWSENIRHLEVYLAPDAFNETNVRRIFVCLGGENPDPHHLIVHLETDWSRVHIPDGRPGSWMSNMPPDPHENDYLRAKYYRRPGAGDRIWGREYFRYSPVIHVDEFDFKTVRIK